MLRADHSSRGVLPTVARRCVITKPCKRGGHSPHWAAEPEKIKIINILRSIRYNKTAENPLRNFRAMHNTGVCDLNYTSVG
jgi:hypothetical protein